MSKIKRCAYIIVDENGWALHGAPHFTSEPLAHDYVEGRNKRQAVIVEAGKRAEKCSYVRAWYEWDSMRELVANGTITIRSLDHREAIAKVLNVYDETKASEAVIGTPVFFKGDVVTWRPHAAGRTLRGEIVEVVKKGKRPKLHHNRGAGAKIRNAESYVVEVIERNGHRHTFWPFARHLMLALRPKRDQLIEEAGRG